MLDNLDAEASASWNTQEQVATHGKEWPRTNSTEITKSTLVATRDTKQEFLSLRSRHRGEVSELTMPFHGAKSKTGSMTEAEEESRVLTAQPKNPTSLMMPQTLSYSEAVKDLAPNGENKMQNFVLSSSNQAIYSSSTPSTLAPISSVGELRQPTSMSNMLSQWSTASVLRGYWAGVSQVAFEFSGENIISASLNQTVERRGLRGPQNVHWREKYQSKVRALASSPVETSYVVGLSTGELYSYIMKGNETSEYLLKAHSSQVFALAFSKDGQLVASGSSDKTIKIWNLKKQRLQKTLESHSAHITDIEFDPNGAYLAVGSKGHGIMIWPIIPGDPSREIILGDPTSQAFAISPSGDRIVSGSSDSMLRIWDVSIGRLCETIKGHDNAVYTVAYSPDGSLIASGSFDRTVKLWKAADDAKELVSVLTGHEGPIYSLAWSPDGGLIASASGDTTIRLWREDWSTAPNSVIDTKSQNESKTKNNLSEVETLPSLPAGKERWSMEANSGEAYESEMLVRQTPKWTSRIRNAFSRHS